MTRFDAGRIRCIIGAVPVELGIPQAELEPRFEYRCIDGLRLHCAVAGRRGSPLVILLHGFPEGWFAWREYIAPLVRAGYRVVVPDQRGYNLSDKPRSVGAFRVSRLAQDVADLLRWEGAKQVNLVGHDWGAAVAWHLAETQPHLVRRLAVLNVPHPEVLRRYLLGNSEQRRRSWYMFFFQLPWLPELRLGRNGGDDFFVKMQSSARPGTFGTRQRARYLSAWTQPRALRSMLNWYRAAMRDNLRDTLRGRTNRRVITVPTSILWGRQDAVLLPAMAVESLEHCDDAALRFFDEAGHWLLHEEREAVVSELIRFFADAR